MSRKKTKKVNPSIDRLQMAEIVLDAVLALLVSKKIMTREEVQRQITDQLKADEAESEHSDTTA